MKRNKLWFLNKKQQLYPLLSNESPFHHIHKIKREADRITGASKVNLTDKYNHYILSEEDNITQTQAHILAIRSEIDIQSKEKRMKQLKRYGLHTYRKLPDERLFLFRMLHLKALVWSRVNESYALIGKPNTIERNSADLIIHSDEILSEIILRQAEVIAARALYAAGLDVGSVLLAISGTGTIAVRELHTIYDSVPVNDELEINHAFRLWQLNKGRPQQTLEGRQFSRSLGPVAQPQLNKGNKPLLLNKQLLAIRQEKSLPFRQRIEDDEASFLERSYDPFLYDQDDELWLGADPEFIFLNSQNEIIPAFEVLTDDPLGRYGYDSVVVSQQVTFPVAELRPDPKRTPKGLFHEIEEILEDINMYGVQEQYKWQAGGMAKGEIPLGGHLHFSGVPITSSLLKLLDGCLALIFSLVEDKDSAELRKPKYGALGDFRRQEHGGFEYRTLPSWLVSPQMTKAAIALAYIIVKEQHQLRQRLTINRRVFEDYLNGHVAAIKEHVEHVFNVLEELESYAELEDWIIPLKNMIKTGSRWNETIDMKESWMLHAYI